MIPTGDLSSSISRLKSQWKQLSDVDRARAVAALRRAGASIRRIARELGFSEANLRHLLKALGASLEDQDLARHGQLTTRELVRRARIRRLQRESERHQLAEAQRIEAAQQAADLICNWLTEERICRPDGERIIDEVRTEYIRRTFDGSLPPHLPDDPKMPRQELIRRWRPRQTCPEGAAAISWYHEWLFRWTFNAFPNSEVRDRALDLALQKQWRR